MHHLDQDDAVTEWAIEFPAAIAVFEKHGIDYSCGGKSLGWSCQQRGVDVKQVIAEIRQSASTEPQRKDPVSAKKQPE